MILLYPLVLVGVVAVFWRRRGEPEGREWLWFAAWCAAGAVFTFSFLSIGLFVFPFAAAALLFVAWRAPHRWESLGSIAGIGVALLLGAFLSRDYRPCPEEGLTLRADAPPGASVECGGTDPAPWLAAGLAAFALPLLAYGVSSLRRRSGVGRHTA